MVYLLFFISIVVNIVSVFGFYGSSSPDWPTLVCLVSLTWLVVYFVATYYVFNTVYLLTTVYIVCLSLFHLGLTIPIGFGGPDFYNWTSGGMSSWLEKAGWSTCLSLGSLGVGLCLALFVRRKATTAPPLQANFEKVYLDGVGLFLAACLLMVFTIRTFGNLLDYSRVDFFRTAKDTRGLGVFLMVFPSSLIMLTVAAKSTKQKIFAYISSAFGFLLLMLSGYRSAALFPLFVGTVLWVKTGRKIPRTLSILLVVGVVLSIPIVGSLRSLGSYNDINVGSFQKSTSEISVFESFRTMGQTAGVLAHVLRLVPKKDGFRYGKSYLHEIKNSIPNILPSKNKSERVAARNKMFSDPEAITRTIPSDWITYRVDRDKYNRGEGLGFTAIGEPYLNFGLFGIFAYFSTLGFLLGCLDMKNLVNSPIALIFSCAMYWPLIRTVRNDFGNFTKPFVFTFIILISWRLFLSVFRRKNI